MPYASPEPLELELELDPVARGALVLCLDVLHLSEDADDLSSILASAMSQRIRNTGAVVLIGDELTVLRHSLELASRYLGGDPSVYSSVLSGLPAAYALKEREKLINFLLSQISALN